MQVHQSFEWLHHSHSDRRHLAAVLILKELALNTPTLFNVHVTAFLDHIWCALYSPKLEVREAAVLALRVCLHDVSKRASRWKAQCYHQLYATAMLAFTAKKSPSPAHQHGSLLVLGELLAPASSDFILSHYHTVADILLRYIRSSPHPVLTRTVVAMVPKLASLSPVEFARYMDEMLAWMLRECEGRERDVSYLSVGQLVLSMGADMDDATVDSVVKHVSIGLVPPTVPSPSAFSSLSLAQPEAAEAAVLLRPDVRGPSSPARCPPACSLTCPRSSTSCSAAGCHPPSSTR